MWGGFLKKLALQAALALLLEAARPLFNKVAEALGQAASFLGDAVISGLISALEELASLATNLAGTAARAGVGDVAEAAKALAREANEMAWKLRNLKQHDVASRKALRLEAQSVNFVMVPKVPAQENMFGQTGRVEPGARGVPRLSSHANMHTGTYMVETGARGVPRLSSHANMYAGTYMVETGAGEAESMIREIEAVQEAARKLKAKVEDTHTIPEQKGTLMNPNPRFGGHIPIH